MAGGSKFSSWLFVTNVSFSNNNHCTYELHGVSASRLVLVPGYGTLTGNRVTFTLSESLPALVFPTGGTASPLQTGYATVRCTYPVTALVLYGLADRLNRVSGMATVFSSQPGTLMFYWVIQGGGNRLGIAMANDAFTQTRCEVAVYGTSPTPIGTATVVIRAKSNLSRFVDELVNFPGTGELTGASALLTCDSPVSTIGLFFNGDVFTTVPATVFVP